MTHQEWLREHASGLMYQGSKDRALGAAAHIDTLERDLATARKALRHAVHRNHVASYVCDGCAEILRVLQEEPKP